MSDRSHQNKQYVEIEENIHRIVYATDGDTDDLITELSDWVYDYVASKP